MPLAVAALVLAVVLGVMRLVDPPGEGVGGTGPGAGGRPEVLRLAGWTPPGDSPDPRYTLEADLPDGPGVAPVHRVVTSTDASPDGLAAALGIDAEGEEGAGVRRWVEDGRQLEVRNGPGGQWSYLSVEPVTSRPDRSDDVAAVSSELAREVGRTVLSASGVDPDAAHEQSVGPAHSMAVDPVVDGMSTAGFTTTVTVMGTTVQSAQGWSASTERGAKYPVITAKEAWDALVRTPLPMPLVACPEPLPEGQDPVACGGLVTVTRAGLGLSLQWSGERPLLVPSWLFEVEGSPQPLVQVALEPAYVRATGDVPTSAPGGGVPGSTGSAAPPSAPSTEPGPDKPMSRFTSVRRGADDSALQVRFWGGVEDCYEYAVRAEESADTVALSLSERTMFDGACIDMAQEYDRTVRLDEPLGGRRVVDADTGETLLGPTH